jgi:hypothetical protein
MAKKEAPSNRIEALSTPESSEEKMVEKFRMGRFGLVAASREGRVDSF